MARALSVMTGCRLAVVPLESVLTCIVNWVKYMRSSVVSMITLLFLTKCNPLNGLLISSLRQSVHRKYYLQFQNLVELLIMVFLTGHWLLVYENWEDRRFWEYYSGLFLLLYPRHSRHSRRLHWQMLQSPPGHLLLEYSQNLEAHRAFLAFVLGPL